MNVFGHFRPIFEQEIDPKYPSGKFLPKRIHQKIFQLKIPLFCKSDDGATWCPNSYNKFWLMVNSEILKGIKNMFGLFQHFFLEFLTFSSQQWVVHQVKNWEQAMFVSSRLYELSKKAQGSIIEKYHSCEIQLSVTK